jgi:hypothetical protein
MNRFQTLGVIGTLAIASFGGAAFAASHPMPRMDGIGSRDNSAIADPPQFGPTTGAGPVLQPVAFKNGGQHATDTMLKNWKGGAFDVVPVGTLDDTALKAELQDHAAAEPKAVAKLQAAIESNRALSEKLAAQNVEIDNIIDAQTALDGGLTFYVR